MNFECENLCLRLHRGGAFTLAHYQRHFSKAVALSENANGFCAFCDDQRSLHDDVNAVSDVAFFANHRVLRILAEFPRKDESIKAVLRNISENFRFQKGMNHPKSS